MAGPDLPAADERPEAASPGRPAGRGPAAAAAVVLRHELRRLALSARTLVFAAVYAGFGALSVATYLFIAARARAELRARAGDSVDEAELQRGSQELFAQVLSWAGWGDAGDAAEILRDRVPLLVLFFFVLASYFLPLLVALVSFDQFSELSTRGARYVLLRVRRGAYFAGKAAAGAVTVALLLAVCWAGVAVAGAFRAEPGEALRVVRESARAWALMCVLALPYLSLTALISSVARPGTAFVATFGAWLALWLGEKTFDWILPWLLERRGLEEAGAQVRRALVLFPWQHAPRLVSRDAQTVLGGVLPLLALAALGYLAAYALVRRRDV